MVYSAKRIYAPKPAIVMPSAPSPRNSVSGPVTGIVGWAAMVDVLSIDVLFANVASLVLVLLTVVVMVLLFVLVVVLVEVTVITSEQFVVVLVPPLLSVSIAVVVYVPVF